MAHVWRQPSDLGWRWLLIAVCLWVYLAGQVVLTPVAASPDDDYHLAMLSCTAGITDCVTEGERNYPCFAWDASVSAACERVPDWVAPKTGQRLKQPYERLQQIPSSGIIAHWYPPGFYQSMALVPRAWQFVTGQQPAVQQLSRSVQLANITLAVVVFAVSLLLTKRSLRGVLTVALMATIVPLGSFLIASVNPSSWLLISAYALIGPLYSLPGFLQDARDRFSAWLPVLAGMGFCLALLLAAVTSRREAPLLMLLLLVCLAVTTWPWSPATWANPRLPLLVLALFYTVFTVMCLVALAAALGARTGEVARASAESAADLGQVLLAVPPALVLSWWNPLLGWLDTPMPPGTGVALAVTTLGLTLGLAGTSRAWNGPKVVGLLGFWAGAIVISVAMVVSRGGEIDQLQPRYALPLVAVGATLAWLPTATPQSPVQNRGWQQLRRGSLRLAAVLLSLVVIGTLVQTWLRFTVGLPVTLGDAWSLPRAPLLVLAVAWISFTLGLVVAMRYVISTLITQSDGSTTMHH